MRAIIFAILISYALSNVSNYKMQLQANIKLKKDFLKDYLRNAKPASVHFDVEVPPGLASVLGYQLQKNALRVVPAKEEVLAQLRKKEVLWPRNVKGIPKLVNYLLQKSVERFHSTIMIYSDKLIEDIKTVKSLSSAINATIYRFKTKLQQYAANLLKLNPEDQLEKDVILLDILQTSNRLVYAETIKCLQNILEDDSLKLKTDIQNILDDIFSTNIQKKQEDFVFVCKMMKICRPFPGFSDYLADFFGELSRLADNKMHTLIMKTLLNVKKRRSDIILLLGDNLVNKLDIHLESVVYNDLSSVKKALSTKRTEILDRYKAKQVSERMKAFRILLDMIDKAFDIDGAEMVAKHFDTITKGLRKWVAGQAIDIGVVKHTFFDYVVETLMAKWVNEANKEARTLVHIIVDGKLGHQHYKYILTNGSTFVNNKN